jgi:hypothetical protein
MSSPAQFMQADRLRFPGMLPAEVLVFKAWLAQHETEYDRFDYNVRLGPGIDPGPNVSEFYRNIAILATQLRMDAVAWKGAQPTIIEVKRRAGPRNIGQLVTYFHVWQADFPSLPTPNLLLLASGAMAGLDAVLAATGIKLVIVPADFTQLRSTTFGRKGGINVPGGS